MDVCFEIPRWLFGGSVAERWAVVEACIGAAGDRDDHPGVFTDLVLKVGEGAHFDSDGSEVKVVDIRQVEGRKKQLFRRQGDNRKVTSEPEGFQQ